MLVVLCQCLEGTYPGDEGMQICLQLLCLHTGLHGVMQQNIVKLIINSNFCVIQFSPWSHHPRSLRLYLNV
jgi:hypothetical protein